MKRLRGTNQYHIRYVKRPGASLHYIWVVPAFILLAVFCRHAETVQAFFTPKPTLTRYISPLASPSPLLSPTPTPLSDRDIINKYPHADIVYRIYGLESSFGKEPFLYCQRQGKLNTMGYNVLNHQCFASFEEQVKTVSEWVDRHQTMSLGKLLCTYNKGEADASCDYAQNFLSL